jgi:hypothetical protein
LWQDERVEFLLFGLEPPSNIARLARQAQESLYAGWGLVSPLALPPLVPLRFASPTQPPSAEALRRLERELSQALRGPAAPRAPRCRTGGWALREGVLFWELEGDMGPLASLAERFCPWPSPQPPPFPPGPGFLLALPEPGADLGRAAAGLNLPPPGSFTTLALALLGVRRLPVEPLDPRPGPPPVRPWYRALEWEQLLRLPLRKSSGKQDSG